MLLTVRKTFPGDRECKDNVKDECKDGVKDECKDEYVNDEHEFTAHNLKNPIVFFYTPQRFWNHVKAKGSTYCHWNCMIHGCRLDKA